VYQSISHTFPHNNKFVNLRPQHPWPLPLNQDKMRCCKVKSLHSLVYVSLDGYWDSCEAIIKTVVFNQKPIEKRWDFVKQRCIFQSSSVFGKGVGKTSLASTYWLCTVLYSNNVTSYPSITSWAKYVSFSCTLTNIMYLLLTLPHKLYIVHFWPAQPTQNHIVFQVL